MKCHIICKSSLTWSLVGLKEAFVKPAGGDMGASCRCFLSHKNRPTATATSPQTARAPTTPPTITPKATEESLLDAGSSLPVCAACPPSGLVVVVVGVFVVTSRELLLSSERHFHFELTIMTFG